MIDFLTSPWGNQFKDLIGGVDSSFLVCSPYIGSGPCQLLASAFHGRLSSRPLDLFVLTDLSRDNMLSGATDVAALASLVEEFPQTEVRFLPSLHAKAYVIDSREAVVTSANFTESGLWRNFEYGVFVSDRAAVARIRADILNYGELGSPVTLPQLRAFAEATADLRAVRAKAEKSLRHSLRVELENRLNEMDEAVLRTRAGDRSLDAILSDAVLYILRDRAMTTPEIHLAVQRIHPDLCDDRVDRIINGRSFGKKWKHAVRRAQYHLKERGKISLENSRWVVVK